MSTAAASIEPKGRVRRRLRKSPFYTLLGLLMLGLAVAGFWPQYFSAVTGRAPDPNTLYWLIHVHAAFFTFWLLFYVSQAALIASGRARIHFAMGPWLAGFGFVAAAIGFFAAGLLAHRFGVRQGDMEAGAAFVFFPLIDMVYFAGFLAAAIVWRKRPDLHKRAMFIATFSIAVVGLNRFVGAPQGWETWLWQAANLAPLIVAAGYDALVCRKLYPVLAVGLALHWLRLNAEGFAAGELWLPIGRALIAPFG